MHHRTHVLSLLALLPIVASCKARTFNSKNSEVAQTAVSSPKHVLSSFKPGANYGAGHDLGIPFAPVDSEVVAAFIASRTAAGNTAADLLIQLGSPAGNKEWASASRSDGLNENSFGMLSPPDEGRKAALAASLQPLLDAYFKATSNWLSLKCLDLSTDQSGGLVAVGHHKLEKPQGALSCRFLNFVGSADRGKELSAGMRFGFSAGRAIDAKGNHKTHWEFQGEGESRYFTVGLYKPGASYPVVSIQSNPDVTVGSQTLPGPSVSLVVLGDFLVPLHSWSISKTTPVPVMRIERKGESLIPGKFYDYGLLTLKSLDKDANLVSVLNAKDAGSWESGNFKGVGNLASFFPEAYGSLLTVAQKVEMATKFKDNGKFERTVNGAPRSLELLWPKTERLEIGALHMTIDAKYGALSHQESARSAVVMQKVDWNRIVADYLGSPGLKAGVHINTLDTIGHHDVSTRAAVRASLTTLEKLCGASWGTVPSHTPGLAIETEIVLSGEWPERFVDSIAAKKAGAKLVRCN